MGLWRVAGQNNISVQGIRLQWCLVLERLMISNRLVTVSVGGKMKVIFLLTENSSGLLSWRTKKESSNPMRRDHFMLGSLLLWYFNKSLSIPVLIVGMWLNLKLVPEGLLTVGIDSTDVNDSSTRLLVEICASLIWVNPKKSISSSPFSSLFCIASTSRRTCCVCELPSVTQMALVGSLS